MLFEGCADDKIKKKEFVKFEFSLRLKAKVLEKIALNQAKQVKQATLKVENL